MRDYEIMLVLHPGLAAPDVEAIHGRFKTSVGEHGGEIVKEEPMGVRELAYPIERQTTGDYHLFHFTGDSGSVADIDRDLRLDEKVLRHLIVLDEKWAEKNRESQAKRKQPVEDADG